MQTRLECPICESQFDVAPGDPALMIVCPECNRQFKTSDAIVSRSQTTERKKLILPEQLVAPSAKPVVAPHPVATPELAPASKVVQQSPEPGATVRAPKTTYSKKPSKMIPVASMGIMAALAIGLMIYLPMVVGGSSDPFESDEMAAETVASATPVSKPAIATDQPTSVTARKIETTTSVSPEDRKQTAINKVVAGFGEGNVPVENPAPRIKPTPTTPPKLRNPKQAPQQELNFFVASDLDDCWRNHHSRIVRLRIANAMGERLALGTIVDTRGWIVTSYRAIAGATEIQAIQTAASFDQFKSGKLLSDAVRGVLAIDIENDLAILSVNRRFVVNFSNLEVATEDTLEPNMHLAQFGLIDDNTPIVVRETKVTGRPKLGELNEKTRDFFTKSGLTSETNDWVEHSNREGTVGGAPLLTIEGKLVAICTEQPDGESALATSARGFAASITPMNDLIESISKDPKTDGGKIPRDLSILSQKLDEVGKKNLGPEVAVEVNNPFRQAVVDFNQNGDKCSMFNFLPSTTEEYESLQAFARQLVELNNTIYSISVDPDAADAGADKKHKEDLTKLLQRWADEMKTALATSPIEKDQIAAFNELAAQSLLNAKIEEGKATYFLAYVRVRMGAMDSPKQNNGEDTITLNMDQTKEILNVAYKDRFPTMLPETLWMAIFTVDTQGKIVFNIPGTKRKMKAHPSEIRWLHRKPLQ